MTFGETIRQLRLDKDINLNRFADMIDVDAANWGKMERGLLTPPSDLNDKLFSNIKEALHLTNSELTDLINIASIERREIPNYVIQNKEVLNCVPTFFSTASGEKPTKEQYKQLWDIIQKAGTFSDEEIALKPL